MDPAYVRQFLRQWLITRCPKQLLARSATTHLATFQAAGFASVGFACVSADRSSLDGLYSLGLPKPIRRFPSRQSPPSSQSEASSRRFESPVTAMHESRVLPAPSPHDRS